MAEQDASKLLRIIQSGAGWPGEHVEVEGTQKRNPFAPGYPKIASATVESDNHKTGPTFATWVTQASCPRADNNRSGYQCPLLGRACYAEQGQAGRYTYRLNTESGVDPKREDFENSAYTPEQIAEAEAAAILSTMDEWRRKRQPLLFAPNTKPEDNVFARLHVVGDCVTPAAAKIVSRAAERLVEPIPGVNPRAGIKNVWAYTHAWRSVPRSAWSGRISVLASLDTFGQSPEKVARDMEAAHRAGYAIAIVLPDYHMAEGVARYGASYELPNGFRVLPCPYEVRRRVREDRIDYSVVDPEKEAERERQTGRPLQCVDCKLCLRDDWLRENRIVIGFALHMESAAKTAKARAEMADLMKLKPEALFQLEQLPVLSPAYDMEADDQSYADALSRLIQLEESLQKSAKKKKRQNPRRHREGKAMIRRRNPEGDREHFIARSVSFLAENLHPESPQNYVQLSEFRRLSFGRYAYASGGDRFWIAWIDELENGEWSPVYPALKATDRAGLEEIIHAALHYETLKGVNPDGVSVSVWATGEVPEPGEIDEPDEGGDEAEIRVENPVRRRRRNSRYDDEEVPFEEGDYDEDEAFEYVEHEDYGDPLDVEDVQDTFEQAESVYKTFHGKPSSEQIELEDALIMRDELAALGQLVVLSLKSPAGERYEIRFDEGRRPLLCSTTDSRQLYISGGDQSVSEEDLMLILDGDQDAVEKDKIHLGTLLKLVYQTEKDFDKFESLEYEHELGEEGGFQPVVVYDRLSQSLELAGGSYKIKREGIVD